MGALDLISDVAAVFLFIPCIIICMFFMLVFGRWLLRLVIPDASDLAKDLMKDWKEEFPPEEKK